MTSFCGEDSAPNGALHIVYTTRRGELPVKTVARGAPILQRAFSPTDMTSRVLRTERHILLRKDIISRLCAHERRNLGKIIRIQHGSFSVQKTSNVFGCASLRLLAKTLPRPSACGYNRVGAGGP